MNFSSIGDMRQHFISLQHNSRIKSDLHTLVEELSTGKKSDLNAHLGASQEQLASIDRQIGLLESFEQANTETGQMLSTMQIALSSIETQRERASSVLLTLNSSSSSDQVANAAQVSKDAFDATIGALNTRYGDRALFGGNSTEALPMAPADTILNSIRGEVSGLTSASAIENAIDAWFDAPNGDFETMAYLGDPSGIMRRPTSIDETVEISVRADSQDIRDVLKAHAKGIFAGEMTLGISMEDRKQLQQNAGVDLLSSASTLANMQANLGYSEGHVAEAMSQNSAQLTSFRVARNDLVSADPFETATRLEAVRSQLEAHYTLTARLSRLSLTEYLR